MINSPMRLDLATEWRSRRWRRLLNIIDRLPRDSAYMEALSDDDELADQLLRKERESRDRRERVDKTRPVRRLSDWSPTVEMLTAILDRLGELTQAVAAIGGAKPGKVPRAPQPRTALDRARNRRRSEGHRTLVGRLLPRTPPAPPPPGGPTG